MNSSILPNADPNYFLPQLEIEEKQLRAKYDSLKDSLVKLFDRLEITETERTELLSDLDAKTYQSVRR